MCPPVLCVGLHYGVVPALQKEGSLEIPAEHQLRNAHVFIA